MRIHSETKINKIKEMRQAGLSINEIVDALTIPKTTVWHHIQNVDIAPNILEILKSKRGGSAVRSRKEWVEAENKAEVILSSKDSKLVISAAMLYWGEGGKKVCDITNTDPKLIQLYLKFLYDVLGMNNDNIKFAVRIFTGMSSEACLKYWSENLKVDQSKFILRYNDGGISGKAKYGICRITLKKGSRILKLMHSLIRLSFSDIMGFKIPVAQWINHRRGTGEMYV
ncbi:MAG: hypothetical protein AAB410_04825 [Patescibacteria group bacterium]